MYEHIIVPFDGTEAAKRAALAGADLSKLLDCELLVVTGAQVENPEHLIQLKEQAMAMSDEDVNVWVEAHTSPANAVTTVVEHRPNSLICMSSHARGGVVRAVYGSLAEKLLRTVDVPVLLLGPQWAGGGFIDLRQLIVCVDGSANSEAAIPLAASWGEALNLSATVLHVRTDTPDRREAPEDLEGFAGPLRDSCPMVEAITVENGSVVDGILDVTSHAMQSVIVMATHGRHGIDRFRHGSVTADLSRRSSVPVLVQRGES